MVNKFADYMLGEDLCDVRDLARKFADEKVKPVAREIDHDERFPLEEIRQLGDLGLLGTIIPEEFGGSDLGHLANAIIMEEISRHSPTLGMCVDAHTSLGMVPVLIAGTDKQKEEILRPAVTGRKILAFGLTEAESGSDANTVSTMAVLDGDEWVINGSKSWITNAGPADYYIVCCKTASKGITAIIVPKGTPGFEIGKPEQKLCMKGSSTAQLFFSDCRVPKENLLGEEGKGIHYFMQGLDAGRIAFSSVALGLAQGALERAAAYAKERKAFGHVITDFQGVSFRLAEMEAQVQTARTILYNVAKMADSGMRYTTEAAICKLTCSEMCQDVSRKAIQIMGGNGTHEEYDVERLYRDAMLTTIGEGTSEIGKLIISRDVLKKY